MTKVPLCRELHLVLADVSEGIKYKIMQFIPSEFSTTDLFIKNQSEDILEIGLTKKNFLAIFKEAHDLFNALIADTGYSAQLQSTAASDSDIYYATTGLLLTTNENHTAITIRDAIVTKLWRQTENQEQREFISTELEVLLSLSNCKISKINKSSSLWLLIRKAYIKSIISSADVQISDLVDRILKSCELHYANYYATTFLRWLVNHMRFMSIVNDAKTIHETMIFDKLRKACFSNMKDSALWGCLQNIMVYEYNAVEFAGYEYNRDGMPTKQLEESLFQQSFNNHLNCDLFWVRIGDIVNWAIDIECQYYTPWNTIKLVLSFYEKHSNHSHVMIDEIRGIIHKESQKYEILNDIEICNGTFKYKGVFIDEFDDLMLISKVKYIGTIKRIMDWRIRVLKK